MAKEKAGFADIRPARARRARAAFSPRKFSDILSYFELIRLPGPGGAPVRQTTFPVKMAHTKKDLRHRRFSRLQVSGKGAYLPSGVRIL